MDKKKKKKRVDPKRRSLIIMVVLLTILLAGLIGLVCALQQGLMNKNPDQNTAAPTLPTQLPTELPTQPPLELILEEQEEININLGYGMAITEIGKYTGPYVEDGSNEIVTGVLMICVTNTGEQDIQYAEVSMALAEGAAHFTLSTLPAGQTVALLEESRLQWSEEEDYAYAIAENIAPFQESLSLQEDKLQIQTFDGGINVTNISGQDITGDIVIYYKNAQQGMFYGGVTYRVRIEGGLKADELRQLMSESFYAAGSQIVFVTIG